MGEKRKAVRVWMLGRFRLSVGSRTVPQDAWHLRKAAALVKLLVLAPSHRLHREQAMELLWPDSCRKAASNSLRRTLHAARTILDPAAGSAYLASEDESLVLCPGGNLWVDVEAFEEAAVTARRGHDPAAYRAAIELYAGELLPGDRYEGWAEEQRQPLRETYLSLLLGLSRIYEERAEYGSAAEALRRVLSEQSTREEAHVGLMRLYALSGSIGEALAQYGRLEEVLLRELGTEPTASSRALREEIAAGRFPPKEAPYLGSLPEEALGTGKHNLPASRTSFVGREREMLEVKRALAMTRLLTLTGAGGSGKTRLALEIARDLVGAYPDGVWLVELAPLSEGSLVSQAVAGALGVQEQPGRSLTDTLVVALHSKETLLVLDNCEHLVQAVAHLVNVLLDNSSKLRILATSRETLELKGEVIRRVPELSQPDPQYPPTAADLEGVESARLFVERATQREPSFTLTMQNAQAVSEICRRLDGIPLAIELAAARVGTLSVEQISERLQDSLGLLTSGGRMAVLRQRTLRGALDWSYDLLSKPERVLFGRLSVFAGGWTLEAAEAVASGESVEEKNVLDLLSGLVNKSLVVANTTSEGEVRYRLLEPIRQYVREKLEESGETEAVRRRHASFFLALAEEAGAAWIGSEEGAWLDRIETEHDNIRAVFSWSLVGGDPDHGLRMAVALWWFYHVRGYHSEGTTWLEGALAKDGAANPTARGGALIGLGRILSDRDDFMRAEECLEEALALYERLGDLGGVAEALNALGWVTFQEGDDPTRAKVLLEKSLAAARESGNRRVIPSALNGLAHIAIENVAFELARKLWGEAVLLSRDQGRASVTSSILFNLGYIELAARDVARATDLFAEAMSLSQELGHKSLVAACLLGLGMAATLQGEPRRAEALIKEGLEINLELESKSPIAEFLEGLAEAAGALGQDLRSARLWGAAAALRRTLDWPWWNAERRLHEPLLKAARSQLEEAAWEQAFAEGQAMNLEEVVEYAIYEDDATTAISQSPDELEEHAQPSSLSRREREIAALVARGLTNRQIASDLSISEHTAATHVRRILKKLNIQSRAQIGSWLTERRSPPSDLN